MREGLIETFKNALTNKEDVLIVTHNNCMDGYGSLLALANIFDTKPSEMDICLLDYSDSIDELMIRAENRLVLFMDFSLGTIPMSVLWTKAEEVLVIDHHESAEKNLGGFDYLKYDILESGATLTWKTFNPDAKMPIMLDYIKDRDLYNWKLKNSRVISAGMHKNLPFGRVEILDNVNIYDISKYISEKEIGIVDYQAKVANSAANKEMKEISLDGLIVLPLINTTTLISDIGNVISFRHPAACMFFITHDSIIFSLRSHRDNPDWVNVAELAEHFGGGGHKHAAGFSFSLVEFDFKSFFIDNVIKKIILNEDNEESTY